MEARIVDNAVELSKSLECGAYHRLHRSKVGDVCMQSQDPIAPAVSELDLWFVDVNCDD
jgi:hypothetical protein